MTLVADGAEGATPSPSERGGVVVLLTAAVTPNVDIGVSVRDPTVRASAYRSALRSWNAFANATGVSLAMVETTGAARDTLWPANCPGNYVSFAAPGYLTALGKGAVEAAAVDAAISRCGWVDDVTLYKCTGRLGLANPEHVLHALGQGTVRLRRALDWSLVDTRLLGADVGTWRRWFSGMGPEVNDRAGRYLEHVTASRVLAAMAAGQVRVQRFPRRPALVGVSGSTGRAYSSPWLRTKSALLRPLEAFLDGPGARRML